MTSSCTSFLSNLFNSAKQKVNNNRSQAKQPLLDNMSLGIELTTMLDKIKPLDPSRVSKASRVKELESEILKLKKQMAKLQSDNNLLRAENASLRENSQPVTKKVNIPSNYVAPRPAICKRGNDEIQQGRKKLKERRNAFAKLLKIKSSPQTSKFNGKTGALESPISKNSKAIEKMLLSRITPNKRPKTPGTPISTNAKKGDFAANKAILEIAFTSPLMKSRREQITGDNSTEKDQGLTLPSPEDFIKAYSGLNAQDQRTLQSIYEYFTFAFDAFQDDEMPGLQAYDQLEKLENFHGKHHIKISDNSVKQAANIISRAVAFELNQLDDASSSSESSDSDSDDSDSDIEDI